MYIIIIGVLLINKSSKPITVTGFSSKELGDMLNASKRSIVYKFKDNTSVNIPRNNYFKLPYTINPYGVVNSNIMPCTHNEQINAWPDKSKKVIKLTVHTSKKDIPKKVIVSKINTKDIQFTEKKII